MDKYCKYICVMCIIVANSISAIAGENDQIIVNVVGKDICLPVTLDTSKGKITFYDSSYTYYGWLQIYGAEDCSGHKINVTSASTRHTNGSVIATYNLTWLYRQYDEVDDEEYNDNYDSYDDTGYDDSSSFDEPLSQSADNIVTEIPGRFVELADRVSDIDVNGYPYGALSVGMSRFYGEFVRFSAKFGGMGGFNMFGGVGKDWIFGLENSDKMAWHIGIGAYISFGGNWADECNQAVTLNVAIGETPLVVNKALACELTYEYFFGNRQRVGLFGGLGFTLGNFKATDPVIDWDFQVGIAFKLWTK